MPPTRRRMLTASGSALLATAGLYTFTRPARSVNVDVQSLEHVEATAQIGIDAIGSVHLE